MKLKLSPKQKEVVNLKKGTYLVISAPGSGKTFMLTNRVANLIEKHDVDPSSILLLTFTNKAAKEMLERAQKIAEEAKDVEGGTFHSFAYKILKRYCNLIGHDKRFTIIDSSDSKLLIDNIRRTLSEHTNKYFPKKAKIATIISKSMNTGKDIRETIEEEEDFKGQRYFIDDIEKIADKYYQTKKVKRYMDFDDLLVNLKLLLEKDEKVRKFLSMKYRYIMIDEVQDLNNTQTDIIRLLCYTHVNVLFCGDCMQSIYKFRGSNVKNILNIPNTFPGCKVITIEQNYRSDNQIIDFANKITDNAKEKYSNSSNMYSKIHNGDKPFFYRPNGDRQQSIFVTSKVKEYIDKGVPLSEIAILARTGYCSQEIEIILNSMKIPFVKWGGKSFIEKTHVKDMLSFLKVAHNKYDPLAWNRVLNYGKGIGPVAVEKILSNVEDKGLKGMKLYKGTKYESYLKSLYYYVISIRKIRGVIDKVEFCFEYYKNNILEKKYHGQDLVKKIKDIEFLIKISKEYKNVRKFVADLTLDAGNDKKDTKGKVIVSTIHSGKGLEFEIVFVINLIEGKLPSKRASYKNEDIEEERRLFYVACTRAKKYLYLVAPKQQDEIMSKEFGMKCNDQSSRFLKEIKNKDNLVVNLNNINKTKFNIKE